MLVEFSLGKHVVSFSEHQFLCSVFSSSLLSECWNLVYSKEIIQDDFNRFYLESNLETSKGKFLRNKKRLQKLMTTRKGKTWTGIERSW